MWAYCGGCNCCVSVESEVEIAGVNKSAKEEPALPVLVASPANNPTGDGKGLLPGLIAEPNPEDACGGDNTKAEPTSEGARGQDSTEPATQDVCSSDAKEYHPDFTGVWKLDRTENQTPFLRAISVSYMLTTAASQVAITMTIDQKKDDLNCVIELGLPSFAAKLAAPPYRKAHMRVGEPEELLMDDAGREFKMINPQWQDGKLVAGVHFVNLPHKLIVSRYIEDGCMVEHFNYASKGLEMRRIYRKVT